VCTRFYNDLLHNYKIVEHEGKTVVNEIRPMRLYWDVNTTVNQALAWLSFIS